MSWYPWSVPDESVFFIQEQFDRFGVPYPPDKVIDNGIAFVIDYVCKNDYFAQGTDEAVRRYESPGLTEPEKYSILAPLEILIKVKLGIRQMDFNRMHLLAWAALLFCWSERSEDVLVWWKKFEMGETTKDRWAATGF
jgi:hypothetical protein